MIKSIKILILSTLLLGTALNAQIVEAKQLFNKKIVKVPEKINYRQALKNTTIFTSTVIFDVEKLGKGLIKMPNVRRGQDTATWWKVLKTNIIAYGLNETLSLYRIT